MQVKDVMIREVLSLGPDAPLSAAARSMRDAGVGWLLVVEDDRPIGVITDRDIVVRVLAEGGYHPDTAVRRAMSVGLVCCSEDVSLVEARQIMVDRGVRRLPVLDHGGRLVGLLSHSDLPGAIAARDSYQVVFCKRMTSHYGQTRDVPVRVVYIADSRSAEDAATAALQRFQIECGVHPWTALADFYHVIEPR